MRLQHLYLAAAAFLAFALASPAAAVSMTVLGWETGERITLTDGRTLLTARLDVVVDGAVGTSFCVDVDHTIGKGTYSIRDLMDPGYATANPPAGEAKRDFVWAARVANQWGESLDSWGPGVTRKQAITGIQAAIWEGIYGGGFVDGSSLSAGARDVYEAVLAKTGDATGNVRIADFTRNQDQTFQPAIPEPSAALVFGIGLVLTAGSARRRLRSARR